MPVNDGKGLSKLGYSCPYLSPAAPLAQSRGVPLPRHTPHSCTHAAATRTAIRAGHSLQVLTPGWQHHSTRALSGPLCGLWWVQSLKKPWLSVGGTPLLPSQTGRASAPSAVLRPWPLPPPRGFFYGGKLGSHCSRSCQSSCGLLAAPSSSRCSPVQETRAACLGVQFGHLKNQTCCAPHKMKKVNSYLAVVTQVGLPLPSTL